MQLYSFILSISVKYGLTVLSCGRNTLSENGEGSATQFNFRLVRSSRMIMCASVTYEYPLGGTRKR